MLEIKSFQNSKIKLAKKLVNKRQREKEQLFLIDYARDLERALDNGYQEEYVFYCEALASEEDIALLSRLDENQIYAVSDDLMSKASYRQNPGGLVAIMQHKPALNIDDAEQVNSQHILAMVDLKKPGNIGAILRTADAAGIDMICLIDSTLDIYNPNIIRASTGTVFLDNIYQMTGDEAFDYFSKNQINIVATHLDGAQSLYDLDFNTGRTAIVLGTEDKGLDETWVKRCDSLVKIPMVGQVSDSLNVSVSGAIFMYEILRQRESLSATPSKSPPNSWET